MMTAAICEMRSCDLHFQNTNTVNMKHTLYLTFTSSQVYAHMTFS